MADLAESEANSLDRARIDMLNREIGQTKKRKDLQEYNQILDKEKKLYILEFQTMSKLIESIRQILTTKSTF